VVRARDDILCVVLGVAVCGARPRVQVHRRADEAHAVLWGDEGEQNAAHIPERVAARAKDAAVTSPEEEERREGQEEAEGALRHEDADRRAVQGGAFVLQRAHSEPDVCALAGELEERGQPAKDDGVVALLLAGGILGGLQRRLGACQTAERDEGAQPRAPRRHVQLAERRRDGLHPGRLKRDPLVGVVLQRSLRDQPRVAFL